MDYGGQTGSLLRYSLIAFPHGASFSYLQVQPAFSSEILGHIPFSSIDMLVASLQSPLDTFIRLLLGHLVHAKPELGNRIAIGELSMSSGSFEVSLIR
jgi:hypothetical protein